MKNLHSFYFQGLCLCLDFQFDTVVRDRPIILSKLLLLHFLKKDIPALSWEFFVNRFETLSLEAQLHLDCNKEFPFPTSRLQIMKKKLTLQRKHLSNNEVQFVALFASPQP